MPLHLEDLMTLDALLAQPPRAADAAAAGAPLLVAIDAIDASPGQPRTEFDEGALKKLAATMVERGVKQPVSVWPHPVASGRWMLNFGARRLRAARLAGWQEIPAFVGEAADSYDQVIENEQREPLRPLELAMFVQRRLVAGESQAEIARRLGKSRQYITCVSSLIDAPEWLMQAYRDDRCRGLQELYELRRLGDEHPTQVRRGSMEASSRTKLHPLTATWMRSQRLTCA